MFREFPMNLRSALRFFYEFTICFANSPWIHYLFRDSTMNSLANTRIHEEFTIFFAILLGDHHRFRIFTMNTLSISQIHLESIFPRIHYFFAISHWNHNLIPEITIDSLSFSRNQFEFTFSFEISQWIHCLFRKSTLNPGFFAKSLWIHYSYAI